MACMNLGEVRAKIAAGWLLCVVSATGLAACDGGSRKQGDAGPSDAGPVKPIPASSFAATFAAAYCESIAPCCTQTGNDSTGCQATLEAEMAAFVTVDTSNTKLAYDETAAGNCIAAVRATLSACTDRALSRQSDGVCQLVFRGTVPVGGSCGQDGDCIQPADDSVGCDSGVCVANSGHSITSATPHGTVGDACAGTCQGNSYGSSCSFSSTSNATALCWTQEGVYCESGTCVATPDIGQVCGFGSYCGANAHCTSGEVCAASLASGGSCDSSYDCLSPSYCDSSSGQCAPAKANGATCNVDYECSGGQCEQSLCRNWTVANAAACAGLMD